MWVGVCAYACTRACVRNPLAREMQLRNKVSLDGSPAVHVFGSRQYYFHSYIWNVLMLRWLWKGKTWSLNNIVEDGNVSEGVVHVNLFGESKKPVRLHGASSRNLQLLVHFLATSNWIELIQVKRCPFPLTCKSWDGFRFMVPQRNVLRLKHP